MKFDNKNLCSHCINEIASRHYFAEKPNLFREEKTGKICERCQEEQVKIFSTKEAMEHEKDFGGEKLKPGQSPKTDAGWIAFAEALTKDWGFYSDMRGHASGIISELLEIIKKQRDDLKK